MTQFELFFKSFQFNKPSIFGLSTQVDDLKKILMKKIKRAFASVDLSESIRNLKHAKNTYLGFGAYLTLTELNDINHNV